MPINRSVLRDFSAGNKREFVLTNGNGSFVSHAINGNLSRRYHGLLIHAQHPPMDRVLTWHKAEEKINGVSLACRSFTGQTTPQESGHLYLENFTTDPLPTWIYCVNGIWLEKQVAMVQGLEATMISYRLLDAPVDEFTIEVDNFVHFRDANDTHAKLSPSITNQWVINESLNNISHKDIELSFKSNGHTRWYATDRPTPDQFHNHLYYEIEVVDQGYDVEDSSLLVNTISHKVTKKQPLYIVAAMEPIEAEIGDSFVHFTEMAVAGRDQLVLPLEERGQFAQDLAVASDQFLALRRDTNSQTILAGFPWFGDWGRDTMIALPGISLVTGRNYSARSILKNFARHVHNGLLPNKFPDHVEPELKYNTIDASLWFFYAVQKFVTYTGDWEFLKKELYEPLKAIVQAHVDGTYYGIKMDEKDGLISGGNASTQLTWMDVKFDGHAVTPRYGKAVEVNALWYNALCFMADCADHFHDEPLNAQYHSMADKVAEHYQEVFWQPEKQYLYDFISEDGPCDDFRPNQILAVSLPYCALHPDKQKAVTTQVYAKLYTPMGLRSLATDHSDYHGQYVGDLKNRDLAYHQGTVWAWLMGPFIDAMMKVYKNDELCSRLMSGIKDHFYNDSGLHCISEVFDGDAPHSGRGCFHQAWSIAEVLRVIVEYKLDV